MKKTLYIFLLLFGVTMSLQAESPSFEIKYVTFDLENQTFNDMNGMVFFLDMYLNHYEGKRARVKSCLEYKDSEGKWKPVKFTNKVNSKYENSKGNVRAVGKKYLAPSHDMAYFKGHEVFLPYNAITHPKGEVDYRIGFFVEDRDEPSKFIKNINDSYYHYFKFSLVWPSSNKAISKSSSSNSQNQVSHNNSRNTNTTRRVNSPNGGYVEYTDLADGRTMVKTVIPCFACHGSSVCTVCWGNRGRWGAAYGGIWYPCGMCAGTGKNHCMACSGRGETFTIAYVDNNGFYGVDSNGATYTGNVAGTVVTSSRGTKVIPNGGSGSSSSNSSRSSKSSEHSYIEKKVYATDYTGNSPDVWCEKCKRWGSRHSHIKERVY